ncbi:MAG: energy transducer TonB [Prevotellaceae bacterium]|jgi:hypothetical protein|nr:energy transducer TonB [Prevotellaceae bacterium]
MAIKKNNQIFFPEKFKRLFLSLFFLPFTAGTLFAQFENLLEFEYLYPDCVDNGAGATIYGGTYPDPWPKGLTLPEFPGGGEVQFTRFVYASTQYPDVMADDSTRLKGVVYVEIVIDRCGKAIKQKVLESVAPEYDDEALRIMRELPVFKPGSLNGVREQVALIIPVYFTRNNLPKKKNEDEYYYDDYNYDY